MVQFTALLEAAWSRERLRPLAVVPFLVSFAYVDNLRRLGRIDGTHFGVSFGFPQPVTTVWTFVNVPQHGSGVNLPSPHEIVLFPVVAVLLGVIGAGYLGSIDAGLDGPYDFPDAVRAYAVPLVGFEFLRLAVVAVLGVVALVSLPLVLPLLVVLLVVAYLFYAAPYLVVAADVGLVDGFRRSFALAADGGPYLEFFVKYLLAVAVVSLAATPLVVNLGLPGAIIGALLLALPALTLNVATMLFVRSLVVGQPSSDRTLVGPNPDTHHGPTPPGQSNSPVDR